MGEKSTSEMIAELEAAIERRKAEAVEQIKAIIAEHALDPRAVAREISPPRRGRPAKEQAPASEDSQTVS